MGDKPHFQMRVINLIIQYYIQISMIFKDIYIIRMIQ